MPVCWLRRRGVPRALPAALGRASRVRASWPALGNIQKRAARVVIRDPLAHGVPFCVQAGDYQKTARFYYKKAEDTYYQANNWAAYDDWRRARDQWDYFYSRNR